MTTHLSSGSVVKLLNKRLLLTAVNRLYNWNVIVNERNLSQGISTASGSSTTRERQDETNSFEQLTHEKLHYLQNTETSVQRHVSMYSQRRNGSILLPGIFMNTRHFSTTGFTLYRTPTSFYDVLEVTPKASHAQVKSSFYRLSKLYHPDINSSSDAQARYTQIIAAYEVLGNRHRRRRYDHGLLNPTDFHSGHEASRDVQDDFSFHSDPIRPGTFKKRRAPPRGRSNIYNFDEFYKQHYGESIKRAYNIKHHARETEKANTETQAQDSMNGVIVSVVIFCMLLCSVFGIADTRTNLTAKSYDTNKKT